MVDLEDVQVVPANRRRDQKQTRGIVPGSHQPNVTFVAARYSKQRSDRTDLN